MEVTDIIIILLFIVPGVIADKISAFIDICDRRKDSEFEELVEGILASLPIIFIVAFFAYRINNFTSTEEFITTFNDIYFVITFTIWALILSVLFGVIKGLLGISKFSIVNLLRVKVFKKVAIDNKTCWQKLFNTDGSSQFLVIENDDKKYEGFIKSYSLPGEEKGLVLYVPEELEPYPQYRKKINKVKHTFIDIEKNIVIKDYDMTEYNNWVDELCKEHLQTIS